MESRIYQALRNPQSPALRTLLETYPLLGVPGEAVWQYRDSMPTEDHLFFALEAGNFFLRAAMPQGMAEPAFILSPGYRIRLEATLNIEWGTVSVPFPNPSEGPWGQYWGEALYSPLQPDARLAVWADRLEDAAGALEKARNDADFKLRVHVAMPPGMERRWNVPPETARRIRACGVTIVRNWEDHDLAPEED